MKVSNLLFSGPMVRAIIREIERPGTGKTQTRRALSANNFTIWTGGLDHPGNFVKINDDMLRAATNNARDFRFIEDMTFWVTDPSPHQTGAAMTQWMGKLPWAKGDLIYVREAWRVSRVWEATRPIDLPPRTMTVFYEAGGSIGGIAKLPKSGDRPLAEYVPDLCYPPHLPDWAGKPRPGMFLPRWASRLTLEVTNVRIERLQDISERDAQAEGAWLWRDDNDPASVMDNCRDAFCRLWDSINGDRPGLAWKYNPWVVAISFRPHLINIDAYLERNAA